jgi:hypothetical protein
VAKRRGVKVAASLHGLTVKECSLSLGPLLSSLLGGSGQGADGVSCRRGRRGRCRQCLLKGCTRWFRPSRPQTRYCSAGCRAAARRWRRWQASRRYRGSASGQERRREQSRRYRTRVQERQRQQAAQLTCAEPGAGSEGPRPAKNPEAVAGVPCQRPGCYVLFVVTSRSPEQHFCSRSCRKALRRVRQREARWRARRRRLSRRRGAAGRAPPRSPC